MSHNEIIGLSILGFVVVVAIVCALRSGPATYPAVDVAEKPHAPREPAQPISCLAKGVCLSLEDLGAWESVEECTVGHWYRPTVRLRHVSSAADLRVWEDYTHGLRELPVTPMYRYGAALSGRDITGDDADAIYFAVLRRRDALAEKAENERRKASEGAVQIFERIGCPESASTQPNQ